ncbi:hypothetical protein [Microbacterium sp. SSM24]|uniref:hypothetical protein n=1 Tax=Microbacterium sp. SSM24 TaxID=2991714 RepID=UPI002226C783|nr:hypothetical protein [Microbacterium sp. SSM24]MCW3491764.1 hypothetical protein [Microbacterium sp. SSM24]
MRTRALTAALVLAAACALSGCTGGSSGSRHTLYDSIDALAADSSAIVVGEVARQRTEGETTISSVVVGSAPTNPQLGAEVDGGASAIESGDVVDVRQTTSPYLEVGGRYALFLTPTMLEGDAASQFYVTGAEAGIYACEADSCHRVALDSGDDLPETIELAG